MTHTTLPQVQKENLGVDLSRGTVPFQRAGHGIRLEVFAILHLGIGTPGKRDPGLPQEGIDKRPEVDQTGAGSNTQDLLYKVEREEEQGAEDHPWLPQEPHRGAETLLRPLNALGCQLSMGFRCLMGYAHSHSEGRDAHTRMTRRSTLRDVDLVMMFPSIGQMQRLL